MMIYIVTFDNYTREFALRWLSRRWFILAVGVCLPSRCAAADSYRTRLPFHSLDDHTHGNQLPVSPFVLFFSETFGPGDQTHCTCVVFSRFSIYFIFNSAVGLFVLVAVFIQVFMVSVDTAATPFFCYLGAYRTTPR